MPRNPSAEVLEFPAVKLADVVSSGAGTVTPDLNLGGVSQFTCTAATITIANPGPADKAVVLGELLLIKVKNTSGGALTITWGSQYKVANTAPATGNQRGFLFMWDGTNWIQVAAAVDVAN